MMFVIEIRDDAAMERLAEYCEAIAAQHRAYYSIRVGIDPLDNGLKFSVNGSTWSPPIAGVVSE